MKLFYTVSVLLGGAALINAQASQDQNGDYICPQQPPTGAYCVGDSLSSNIILRCSAAGAKAAPGNCNDNLAGVPPVGVKTFAPCWQSSPTAGDAACSFNGTVYATNGTFQISGSSTTTTSPTSSTTSSSTSSIPSSNSSTSSSSSSSSSTTSPLYTNGTTTTTPSTSSTVTVVTVCPSCSTTGAGFSIGGPSTYTTVVTPTASASSQSSSGSGASPTLAGNDASGISGRTGMGIVAGLLAGLLAWGMI